MRKGKDKVRERDRWEEKVGKERQKGREREERE